MRSDVIVIDYGLGNIGSVVNMLQHIGVPARTSRAPGDIIGADKLILPGVGTFDAGARALRDSGVRDAVIEAVVERKAHILGICLGMQLLFGNSEEGDETGLGLLRGEIKLIKDMGGKIRVPHMGWNVAEPVKSGSLFDMQTPDQRFYFVHSYHASCEDPADLCAVTNYGQVLTAAVERGNISGVQFHPEKSHQFGMRLLSRFAGHGSC